jgi:hypothetical protein
VLEVRDPQRPEESDEDFEKRDKAHWAKVEENEKRLLAAREAHRRRIDGSDSNEQDLS